MTPLRAQLAIFVPYAATATLLLCVEPDSILKVLIYHAAREGKEDPAELLAYVRQLARTELDGRGLGR